MTIIAAKKMKAMGNSYNPKHSSLSKMFPESRAKLTSKPCVDPEDPIGCYDNWQIPHVLLMG